jgi:ABC-type nitrate/sulfonate/bicarbonate transport system permease component
MTENGLNRFGLRASSIAALLVLWWIASGSSPTPMFCPARSRLAERS